VATIQEFGEDWIRYTTEDPSTTNPKVLRYVMDQGAEVLTLSRVSKSLEDVYLTIVEEDEGQEAKAK
jgi:hypothetical protein